jgi:hypothetical protein
MEQVKKLNSLATEDFQNRKGNFPQNDAPIFIRVYDEGENQHSVTGLFKSTSEKEAETWLNNYLKMNGFTADSCETSQEGDYHNDWVEAFALITIV